MVLGIGKSQQQAAGSSESFGEFAIEAQLGEGAMGVVHRARDGDGNVVALKIVKPQLAHNEEFRRRFTREVRAARRIDSPHVVSVLGDGEVDGTPYMAQEFMSGGSLAQLLKLNGPLELERAVGICGDFCRGLEAMHAEGIVHRDLKPENILLDANGRAKVGDFGLVKDREASVMTRPGQTLGSVHYMAPEQIRGEQVNPASDVYASGCVMFEVLSGSPPFGQMKGMQVMWGQLRDDPDLSRSGLKPMQAGAQEAILAALQKEPADRPPSPAAFARMLADGNGASSAAGGTA